MSSKQNSGKSKWGLSKWGLKVLVRNCPWLPTIVAILQTKIPFTKGHEKCTIAHGCAQIAGSGPKPPLKSPHLDFPEELDSKIIFKSALASEKGT